MNIPCTTCGRVYPAHMYIYDIISGQCGEHKIRRRTRRSQSCAICRTARFTDPPAWTRFVLSSARERASWYGQEWSGDITAEVLVSLLVLQDYRCATTGLELVIPELDSDVRSPETWCSDTGNSRGRLPYLMTTAHTWTKGTVALVANCIRDVADEFGSNTQGCTNFLRMTPIAADDIIIQISKNYNQRWSDACAIVERAFINKNNKDVL